MDSKSVVKIDTYESNNKTITLNNIYYDYVKGIIYQINEDKVNIYKPRNHHFIIWQGKAIFLSMNRLDHYVIRKQCNEYLMDLKKKNPNVVIVSEALNDCY